MNNCSFIGRTTDHIELKQTNSGKYVCNFSLAVYRDKENTDFIRCIAWEKTAKMLQNYVIKGDQIGVVGRLQQKEYTDRDGNNRTSYEIIVNNISLLSNKKEGNGQSQASLAHGYGNPSNYTANSQNFTPQPAQKQYQIGDLSDFEGAFSDGDMPF